MAQDTRKDPRAKVLTMTVRYKSATLDEFIEHHSYDISRGGMFIKTPSPFPPGTLLKFEVKIADDQRLMQGVGRVIWKREPPDTSAERPGGMGIKFIKIDEQSKKLIDQLVTGRGEGAAAFEHGEATSGMTPAAPLEVKPAAERPLDPETASAGGTPIRKATMIGLGAMPGSGSEAARSEPAPEVAEPPAGAEPTFFPKTDPEKEMPAPEDRTVMKQAAELLEDALREASASPEEANAPVVLPPPTASTPPVRPPTPVPPPSSHERRSPTPATGAPAFVSSSAPRSTDLRAESPRTPPAEPARAVSRPPASEAARERRAPRVSTAPPAESGGGGGKAIALLLGVAAAAGLVFFLTREKPEQASPEPAPAAQEPAAVTEPVAPLPVAPVTTADAATSSDASADAASSVDAGTSASSASAAALPDAGPALDAAAAAKPAPPATPRPRRRATPTPKPAEPKPAEPSTEEAPAPTPAEKPEQPPSESAPAPQPKPETGDDSDNPY